MLGFFSTTCPVGEESREWVDRRFARLLQEFGSRALQQVILPTPEFFPDPYDGSDAAAERLFHRVRQYMAIDAAHVHFRLVTARPDPRGKLFIVADDGGAAGTYLPTEAGDIITVERRQLEDPTSLVATIAHELCHVLLLSDGRVSRDAEDHEPLTDLLTVAMGLGIFGANSSVQYAAWSDGKRYGWNASSLGYLRQKTWGYALARFALARNEHRPAWLKHLRLDVRSTVRQSLRYLGKRTSAENQK